MAHPRNPKNWCSCGARCKNSASNLCQTCWSLKTAAEYGERTIKSLPHTSARHRYQNLRNHAQRIVKLLKWPMICKVCSYSSHVEICHRKGIASFSEEAKLSEVNAPDNLVLLCPNHHWELDNRLLILPR